MQSEASEILPDRLQKAIKLRKTSPAQLARDSGINKATISLILAGERPNTPAAIVAKMARAMDVSVDYLLGITENPQPMAMDLDDTLIELTQVAKQLTDRRKGDLLMDAHTYLAARKQLKKNPALLMDKLLDLIEEAGGKADRDQLIDSLNLDADDEGDSSRDDDPNSPAP